MSQTHDISGIPTIRCAGVSKVWTLGPSNELTALRDVDLEIAEGEFVVFLGPSGCGKSTLLYLIAGLQTATTGTIEHRGKPVTRPCSSRSMIFQETSLYPWLSVGDNVAFGLKIAGLDKVKRREVAAETLREVGLGQFFDKRPDQLSGGMRQRVAVARALAMKPDVLLMDEPFAALDIQTRAKLQDFLIQVWRESGASVAFVTHGIEEAISLADRVVVFTARPGTIKEIVKIDLSRPRDVNTEEFRRLRIKLSGLLADEVDRAFAQQESAIR